VLQKVIEQMKNAPIPKMGLTVKAKSKLCTKLYAPSTLRIPKYGTKCQNGDFFQILEKT
jgi:hypothetical protein